MDRHAIQLNKGKRNNKMNVYKIKELNEHIIRKKPNYDSLGIQLREASSTQQFTPRTIGFESLNAKFDTQFDTGCESALSTTFMTQLDSISFERSEPHNQAFSYFFVCHKLRSARIQNN